MKRLFAVLVVLSLMFAFACDDGQEELMTATNDPIVETDTVAPTIVGIHESNFMYYDPPNPYYVIVDGSTMHQLNYFVTIKVSEAMDFDLSQINVYKIAGTTTLIPMYEQCLDDSTVYQIRPLNESTGWVNNWEANATYVMQGVVFDKAGNSVVLGPLTFYTGSI